VAATAIRNPAHDLKAFASWLAQAHYAPEHRLAAIKLPRMGEIPTGLFTGKSFNVIFGPLHAVQARKNAIAQQVH